MVVEHDDMCLKNYHVSWKFEFIFGYWCCSSKVSEVNYLIESGVEHIIYIEKYVMDSSTYWKPVVLLFLYNNTSLESTWNTVLKRFMIYCYLILLCWQHLFFYDWWCARACVRACSCGTLRTHVNVRVRARVCVRARARACVLSNVILFHPQLITHSMCAYRFRYRLFLPKINWSFWDILDVWEKSFDAPNFGSKPNCTVNIVFRGSFETSSMSRTKSVFF